ncbi:MAG: gamma-glutamylcyclotransferase [Actinobacteria bacterium]|nr:MAG: gamma-glutamylcyclotransferase [Actinomycetota bacterium]
MSEVAPGAEFQFIAHLPQWALDFTIDGNGWNGALPDVHPDEGSTVWGAVFKVPDRQAAALHAIEQEEGRRASTVEAMDRMGKRHLVTTHVSADRNGNGAVAPSPEYLRLMLSGSRHWSLPAGWIAGLEEHLDGAR